MGAFSCVYPLRSWEDAIEVEWDENKSSNFAEISTRRNSEGTRYSAMKLKLSVFGGAYVMII